MLTVAVRHLRWPSRKLHSSEWFIGKRWTAHVSRLHLSAVQRNEVNQRKYEMSYVCGPGDRPLLGLSMGQVVQRAAEKFGDATAVVDVHQNIRKTYSQMLSEADKLAAAFLSFKLNRGDRVGIWGPNSYEWIVVQWAAARAGLVLVNINPSYKSSELTYAINKVGIKTLVMAERFRSLDLMEVLRGAVPELETTTGVDIRSSRCPSLQTVVVLSDTQTRGTLRFQDAIDSGTPSLIETIHNLQRRIQFDEPANIQFTSGTTGNPKGATLSHHNIVNNAFVVGNRCEYYKEPHRLCIQVPLYHCFGCATGVVAATLFGSTSVLPNPAFSGVHTMKAIDQEKCTVVYGTPTMFVDMLNVPNLEQYDVSKLRMAFMGGAPVPEELAKGVSTKLNVQVVIGFGMTETSPVTFQSLLTDTFEQRTTRLGFPTDHLEAKIVNPETGEIVPVNTPGELCTRGYNTMLGYWDDPDKTSETIKSDRWLHTGDIGMIDENGYGLIVGRIKDMIIRGGENVYPKEIEDLLHTHPHVLEAHVIGVPDRRMGEELCAWVRHQPDVHLSASDLIEFCRARVAHFKVPRYWLFRNEFPMTVTGKVQKFRMREITVKELGLDSASMNATPP